MDKGTVICHEGVYLLICSSENNTKAVCCPLEKIIKKDKLQNAIDCDELPSRIPDYSELRLVPWERLKHTEKTGSKDSICLKPDVYKKIIADSIDSKYRSHFDPDVYLLIIISNQDILDKD